MNINSNHVGFLVGAAVLGMLGLASCSTEDADPPMAAGGMSGAGTTGGATSGGSAGSTSSGGTSGSGGSGGAPMACVPQPAPLGGVFLDEGTADANPDRAGGFFSFGDFTNTFSGGNFIYPEMGTYPLTSTWTSGGNWNISGTVGDYSGFGFYFRCRSDLSAFDGIAFTISGSVGTPPLTMRVGQTTNTYEAPGTAEPKGGTCVPADLANTGASCTEPKIVIEVTADPVEHEITWDQFTGGLPIDTVNPANFMDFGFYFAWGGEPPVTTAYEVDVTLDNVRFMGGPPPMGGSGGTGGTSGGTGGTGTGDAGMGGAP
jgi:hypothetical protein